MIKIWPFNQRSEYETKSVPGTFSAEQVLGTFLFSLVALGNGALVRERVPLFHSALTETLGVAHTNHLLEPWNETEVTELEALLKGVLDETILSKTRIRSADNLFVTWGENITGRLGEIFGSAILRNEMAQQSGVPRPSFFLSENEYRNIALNSNRPDGIVYSTDGETILIQTVLESKLGNGGYNRKQADGMWKHWQENGLKLPDQPVPFPNEKIFFVQSDGTQIPLATITRETFEPFVFLVATRSHPTFTGRIHQLPFAATKLREAIYVFIQKLVQASPQPVSAERVHHRTPVLSKPIHVESFQRELVDWIIENDDFPKTSSPTALGVYLAREISRRGSQSHVFIHDLDGATRHLMTLKKKIPAISPLSRELMKSSPSDPNVISALRAYVRVYEAHQIPFIAGQPRLSPMVAVLKSRSPEWAQFFAEQPNLETELFHADIAEIDACLTALVAAARN